VRQSDLIQKPSRYALAHRTATHCNRLQRTVSHCNTLQHTLCCFREAPLLCSRRIHAPLSHAATRCNTLQHVMYLAEKLRCWVRIEYPAPPPHTHAQHTATHCPSQREAHLLCPDRIAPPDTPHETNFHILPHAAHTLQRTAHLTQKLCCCALIEYLTLQQTLQHTATHCSTLQHTATYCNALQRTATPCNTLHHTATHCNARKFAAHWNTLQRTATHCNTLQHIATHCNTLRSPTVVFSCI